VSQEIVAEMVSTIRSRVNIFIGRFKNFGLIEDVMYRRLMRRGIHLHPSAVILAVLAGAELDGVAGMLLSVPTVALASVVHRHWLEWRSGDDEVNVLRLIGTG
jgi:predicted PurR-regulated permease PerM